MTDVDRLCRIATIPARATTGPTVAVRSGSASDASTFDSRADTLGEAIGGMMALQFERADLTRDRTVLTQFNVAYLDWIGLSVQERFGLSLSELLGASIPAYVESALDKLCAGTPPMGVFYLVGDGASAVGMGGLRRLRDGVAEIKRIYVPKTVRGGGIGAQILGRLMEDARAFGFAELMLDTGPFMTSAHRLYEAVGFVDVPPYSEAEVPAALHHDWRFMRCKL